MKGFKSTSLWLLLAVALASYQVYISVMLRPDDDDEDNNDRTNYDSPSRNSDDSEIMTNIQKCSTSDLAVLKKQLPSLHCNGTKKVPWFNKCSFSYATRCPSSQAWLGQFINHNRGRRNDEETFVGISIGCNKGYDALDTAQWGTFDIATFDRHTFRNAKGHSEEDEDLRCEKYSSSNKKEEKEVLATSSSNISPPPPRQGEMHCVEALPSNFRTLQKASEALNLTAKGFIVSNAAISDRDGETLFPRGDDTKEGKENLGMNNCKWAVEKEKCTMVKKYTLDSYVAKFVKSNNNMNGTIHHLSIDIEGYDASALMGASNVLTRTEYLEFEYNWMGDWRRKYPLSKIITMLEEKFQFACYFIGNEELWRITHGCWQEHYSIPFWSNVGCVSVDRAPKLLKKTEHMFRETLAKDVSDLNYIRNPRQIKPESGDKIILQQISRGILY